LNTASFHVEPGSYERNLPDLRAVREAVFIVEQQVSPEEEWDDLDAASYHLIARDQNGTPIGTGRLTPEMTIGRMAVVKEWRGSGVGAAVLQGLIERARELHYPAVELHAQTHAIAFYERFGFVAFGEEYMEAGIPHRSMKLSLALRRARPEAAEPPSLADGEPVNQLIEIDNFDALRRVTLELISAGRRELCIYTRDFDPPLLGTPEALEAFRQFAIGTKDAKVRILAHDATRATREVHGLIALAQRLPSHFEFRLIEQEPDTQYPSAFVLNDRDGYLFRPIATRFESSANFDGAARARQLADYFDEVWERARPAAELRALS
jgi:predicted GNAT family N-acyltransferase